MSPAAAAVGASPLPAASGYSDVTPGNSSEVTAAAVAVFTWYDADGKSDLGELMDRALAALGELAH